MSNEQRESLVQRLAEAACTAIGDGDNIFNDKGLHDIIADALRAHLPAGGEVVVPLSAVLRFVDLIATGSNGLRHEYVESRSGSMVKVPDFHAIAHPPAVDARVAELEARISDLELEAQLETCIREKLSEILTRTANVLKGEPDELTVHSWHDLAEIAGRRIAALDQQLAASREREVKLIADLDANLEAFSDERKRALSAESLARELHELLADYVSQDEIAGSNGYGIGGETQRKAEALLSALAAEKGEK